MATVRMPGFSVAGIVCAVPRTVVDNASFEDRFGAEGVGAVARATGVLSRRIADEQTLTSDLCCAAGQALLGDLEWAPSSVDALILVTQTPDYVLPATSCVLQERLQLAPECAAFDVNLGCSGYVYGLWLAASLLRSGAAGRVLLLAGDTISKLVCPCDRGTAMLFGDAGSATALVADAGAEGATFVLGTDGRGAENLIVPAGGFRRGAPVAGCPPDCAYGGPCPGERHLHMSGADIFTFTLERVPPMVNEVLGVSGSALAGIDLYVMHQANEFIIKHLSRKLGLPAERVPVSLRTFGNTSSASIPLTLVAEAEERLRGGGLRAVLAGFGVGYSWGAATLPLGPLAAARMVET
jgi:3-oxoacyl-[acyl-carrier-protein] synthase-3